MNRVCLFMKALIVSCILGFSVTHSLVAKEGKNPLTKNRSTIACSATEDLGRFEQCEEVLVLTRQESRARVYSKPRKKVFDAPQANVFEISEATQAEVILKGQRLLIPSSRLWNSSRQSFLSICEVVSISQSRDLLTVNCGHLQNEKIFKKSVFVLSASAQ